MERGGSLRRLILTNTQAPGDLLMMTAAVRDLHRCYPGKFITSVRTTAEAVWENNPYIQPSDSVPAETIRLGYPLIHRSNQSGLHFIQGFIDDLNKKLNLKVRLTEFRPDLHWTTEEINTPLIEGPYWIIVSGGKEDFTTKWWDPSRYQEVVDKLNGEVAFVQIGGKPDNGGAKHHHPPLDGTINLVGKTTLREALRLVLHARGVVSPVTCFMHAAAAVGKPAVVVAGGREHWTWEAYDINTLRRNMAYAVNPAIKLPVTEEAGQRWSPQTDPAFVDHPFCPHKFLHTIGDLRCCLTAGCWKTTVTEGRPHQNCSDVVRRPGRPVLPRCLNNITADAVIEHIRAYELTLSKGQSMPSINDLIVKLDTAAPPPEQPVTPVEIVKDVASPMSNGPIAAEQLNFKYLTFPVTLCTITFGDHANLAIRCLESVYRSLPAEMFKVRVGMNALTAAARKRLINYLESKSNIEVVYEANPQIYKSPMLRKMLQDAVRPLTTDWVLWFDDDSQIEDPTWILRLGAAVDANYARTTAEAPNGYHMYGKLYYWHLRGNQRNWIETATWYAGKAHAKDMSKHPPSDKVDFCAGAGWLLSKVAIMATDWPDPRMRQNGDDIMCGAALRQQGFGIYQCCNGISWDTGKRSDACYDEPVGVE